MAQIDVNYTIYYPLTEKYLSLYPQEKKRQVVEGHNQKVANTDDDDDDEGEEESVDEEMQTSEDDKPSEKEGEKPPMWDIIKKCMAEKTLDKLRDGKLNIGFDGKPIRSLDGTAATSNVVMNTGKEKAETTTNREKEKKRKRKEVEAEKPKEDEEDSDGGFFEE